MNDKEDVVNTVAEDADVSVGAFEEVVTSELPTIDEKNKYQKTNFLFPKDLKTLKSNNYDMIGKNFSSSYVIRNKKTGQVVEIRAASSYHAAQLIGWRSRQVELIDVIGDTIDETDRNQNIEASSDRNVGVGTPENGA